MTGAWDDPAVRAAVRTAAATRGRANPGHWCHLETAALDPSGSWRAACECGWTGRWRTTRLIAREDAAVQAVQDGLDHQAEHSTA